MKRMAAILAAAAVLSTAPALALEAGDEAPDFEAPSTKGTIRLSDYRGRNFVLLAFYFQDFTGG